MAGGSAIRNTAGETLSCTDCNSGNRIMKSIITVAQIKIVPEKGSIESNCKRLMAVLEKLSKKTIDVVVTPEGFLDGYVSTQGYVNRKNIMDYAVDPVRSPYVRSISEWARKNSSWVILGCIRLSENRACNTTIIFNRGGNMAGWYDKTHCQAHDRKYLAGNSLHVFNSDFGCFGVMICADRRWPEVTRTLALKGARIIFNPTYGMHNELNLAMMQTRSFESECFIIFTHPAQSLITGPGGRIITNEEDKKVSVAVTRINLSLVERARKNPCSHLKNRRPELYLQDYPAKQLSGNS